MIEIQNYLSIQEILIEWTLYHILFVSVLTLEAFDAKLQASITLCKSKFEDGLSWESIDLTDI